MTEFFQLTLGGLIGSSIATTLLGLAVLRRTKFIEQQIKADFDRKSRVFESTLAWRQQSLFELLGPVAMQLARTNEAFARWTRKDLGLEAKVIRRGNLAIRDLLLAKGHLIPGHLHAGAIRLITHYDAWLLRFDEVRRAPVTSTEEEYVFVGPAGYPFPKDAEQEFLKAFQSARASMYDPSGATLGVAASLEHRSA